jgi:chromosome segregation ATPase
LPSFRLADLDRDVWFELEDLTHRPGEGDSVLISVAGRWGASRSRLLPAPQLVAQVRNKRHAFDPVSASQRRPRATPHGRPWQVMFTVPSELLNGPELKCMLEVGSASLELPAVGEEDWGPPGAGGQPEPDTQVSSAVAEPVPEVGVEPEVVRAEPELTAEHEPSPEPQDTAEHELTPKPEVSTEPEPSVQPDPAAAVQRSLEDLIGRIQALESQVAAEREQRQSAEQERQRAEQEQQRAEHELQDLRDAVGRESSRADALSSQRDAAVDALRAAHAEFQPASDYTDELIAHAATLEAAVIKAGMQAADLAQRLEQQEATPDPSSAIDELIAHFEQERAALAAEFDQATSDLRAQIEERDAELAAADAKLQESESELEAQDVELTARSQLVESLRDGLTAAQARVEAADRVLADATAALAFMEQQGDQIQVRLSSLGESVEALDSRAHTLAAATAWEEMEPGRLDGEVDRIEHALLDGAAAVQDATDAQADAERQREEAERVASTATEDRDRAVSMMTQARETVLSLGDRLGDVNGRVKSLDKEFEALSDRDEALERRLADAERIAEQLVADAETVRRQVGEGEQRSDDLERSLTEMEELRARLRVVSEQREALERQLGRPAGEVGVSAGIATDQPAGSPALALEGGSPEFNALVHDLKRRLVDAELAAEAQAQERGRLERHLTRLEGQLAEARRLSSG